MGLISLLQGIFPTQGSNPDLPHCRRILYQLSHQGRPRILEWAAYPFSSGFSWPRKQTGVSWTAGGFFTSWATREALLICREDNEIHPKAVLRMRLVTERMPQKKNDDKNIHFDSIWIILLDLSHQFLFTQVHVQKKKIKAHNLKQCPPAYAACEVGQTSRSPTANNKHEGRAVLRKGQSVWATPAARAPRPSEGTAHPALNVRLSCFFKWRQLIFVFWWVGWVQVKPLPEVASYSLMSGISFQTY